MEFPVAHVHAGEQAEWSPGPTMTTASFHGMFVGILVVVHLEVDLPDAVV